MAAVALIGPDGAGKTTLTRMLEQSGMRRFKYMYMGIAIPESNVALPSARVAEKLKSRLKRRGGAVWSLARLGNRLADEWYRQLVSWSYQRRGFTVLYDRHFLFDFSPEIGGAYADRSDRRIHRWFLDRLYPRPDLILFLDAPGEVLFARKGEHDPERLERVRRHLPGVVARLPGFKRVDATRPMPEVYAEVAAHVAGLDAGRQRRVQVREATQ